MMPRGVSELRPKDKREASDKNARTAAKGRELPNRSGRPVGSLADTQKIIFTQHGPQRLIKGMNLKGMSSVTSVISLDSTSQSSQSQPKRWKLSSNDDDDDDEGDQKTPAELEHEKRNRALHSMQVNGLPKQSPQPGYDEVESVRFSVDSDPASRPITVKKGSWVLADVETFGKDGEAFKAEEVALVLAILQDRDGDIKFAVRWAWTWTSMFMGSEGPEALQNPKQIFLQRNHCLTGNCDQGPIRVQEKSGEWVDLCPWEAVRGLAIVRHRSQIPNLKLFCKQSRSFFYDKEFDNASWRLTQIDPVEGPQNRPPKRLKPSELTMGDMFSGLGTVALAAGSAGMQAQYCVEMDECAFNAASLNMNGKLKLDFALSLSQFVQGIEEKRPGYPQRGDLAVLHLSPPCQSLSMANRTASLERVEEELYPILADCVKLIKILQPKYVTFEEVPGFLVRRFANVKVPKEPIEIHPGLHILAPLVDAGYQAHLSMVNSLFYGVPQHRKRVSAFFALPDYELPLPPPPRYFADICVSRMWMQGVLDTMRRDSMHWNSIYITPHGTLESLKEAIDMPGVGVLEYDEVRKQIRKLVEKEEEEEEVEEEQAAGRIKRIPNRAANPRGLPLRPSASLALDDLGVPKIADSRAQSFCKSRYKSGVALSRYAAFCRTPLVRDNVSELVEDHNIRSNYMVDAETSSIARLNAFQRCLLAVKDKPSLRVGADDPYNTICTIPNMKHLKSCMHHREFRTLTLAEKKRIQSIPDDVYLIGDEEHKSRQVGNAVPFLLARAIMDAVYQAATGLPPLPFPHVSGMIGDAEEALDVVDERSSVDCAIPSPVAQQEPSLLPGTSTKDEQSMVLPLSKKLERRSSAAAGHAKQSLPVPKARRPSLLKEATKDWSWVKKESAEEVSGSEAEEATSPEKQEPPRERPPERASPTDPKSCLKGTRHPHATAQKPASVGRKGEVVEKKRLYGSWPTVPTSFKKLAQALSPFVSERVSDAHETSTAAVPAHKLSDLVQKEPEIVKEEKRQRSSTGSEGQTPPGAARIKRRKHRGFKRRSSGGKASLPPSQTSPASKEPSSGKTVYKDICIELSSGTDSDVIDLC